MYVPRYICNYIWNLITWFTSYNAGEKPSPSPMPILDCHRGMCDVN